MNEKIPDPSPKVGNTSGAPVANSVASPQRKSGFPWFPVVTLALVAAGIAAVQWRPELERNLRAWATAALTLLGTLTLLIWFLASSRFRARTRLVGLAIVILSGLALKGALRVDGTINGTGLPRLVWRGSHSDATPPTASPAETVHKLVHAAALPGLEDSAQFLGPDRTGVLPIARFYTNWTTQAPRELWRRPIGLGWSSFAVVGGQAWTQEQVGDDERVICINVATGQTLWSHSERTRFSEWQGGDGPRATPTVQDGRVYAMGGTGILLCLDAATGRLVWRRSVLEENGLSNLIWGTSSSPLIVDGLTVITGGRGSGAVLYAYRSSDGSPAWKSGDGDASYASPILATLAGRRVILSNNATSLTAHVAVLPPIHTRANRRVLARTAAECIRSALQRMARSATASRTLVEPYPGAGIRSNFNNCVAIEGHQRVVRHEPHGFDKRLGH